jgi:2'-5' RNA ligase
MNEQTEQDEKRLFFGLEIAAPWPEKLPTGRVIDASDRHVTVAFLGKASLSKVLESLPGMPQPDFSIGPAGIFDQCLFFPKRHPRCAAWNIHWLSQGDGFARFYAVFTEWLENEALFQRERRPFCAHVTISRAPFKERSWERAFKPIPVITKALHLYESLGHSTYRSCWNYPFQSAFEEIEHTADIAFLVRGQNLQELYLHAKLALAFTFPELVHYFSVDTKVNSLEEAITKLNHLVAEADAEKGCPFKAVSFHGEVTQTSQNTFEWEMIVDV